jgi:hypothetical protein
MKPTNQSPNGTSFHKITLDTTLGSLRKVLGAPRMGDDKSQFEWVKETEDGDVFTVYDWKEDSKIDPNQTIRWHIGGKNKLATLTAKLEILDALEG